MYILMFMFIFIACYIHSFKDNFRPEAIEKVTPVIIVIGIVTILFSILACII